MLGMAGKGVAFVLQLAFCEPDSDHSAIVRRLKLENSVPGREKLVQSLYDGVCCHQRSRIVSETFLKSSYVTIDPSDSPRISLMVRI